MREAMWGPVGYCSSSTCSIENDESERGMIKHWCPSIGIYLREGERERETERETFGSENCWRSPRRPSSCFSFIFVWRKSPRTKHLHTLTHTTLAYAQRERFFRFKLFFFFLAHHSGLHTIQDNEACPFFFFGFF